MTREKNIPEWIKWVASVMLSAMSAGVGVTVFMYQNFETVAAAEQRENHLKEIRGIDSQRLERIEQKIDQIISQGR
jgi:hypothetical protein